jgi:hypothetical protein
LGGDLGVPLIASFRPAILDRDNAVLDAAEFAQLPDKKIGPDMLAVSVHTRNATVWARGRQVQARPQAGRVGVSQRPRGERQISKRGNRYLHVLRWTSLRRIQQAAIISSKFAYRLASRCIAGLPIIHMAAGNNPS